LADLLTQVKRNLIAIKNENIGGEPDDA